MPKHLLYGPVIGALVGAMCGVEAAMLFLYDRTHDRVYLEQSVPLAITGAFVGFFLGALVEQLHLAYPRLRAWIEVTATASLLATMFTGIGWLLGDKWVSNPPSETVWGFVGGFALGACFGVVNLLLDRRMRAKFSNSCHELGRFVDTGPDLGQFQKMDQEKKPG